MAGRKVLNERKNGNDANGSPSDTLSCVYRALYEAAFNNNQHRERRSTAYKNGVMYALRYRAGETKVKASGAIPYEMGTSDADAWLAGLDEGYRRWRDYSSMSEKLRDAT